MLTEDKIVDIIAEEIDKKELLKYIEHDKDFEKKVKTIVSDVITELFRVLWQHNGIFKNLSK